MFDESRLKEALIDYRRDFVSRWKDEKYKWVAVKHFQDHWDVNAGNFAGMLKESLSRTDTLLASMNNFPAFMICGFAQTNYDVHTLHSGNMYQIFTYVKNKEAEVAGTGHEVSGMLLYAKTDEEIVHDNVYRMSGNKISVKTLDLNCEFPLAARQLN